MESTHSSPSAIANAFNLERALATSWSAMQSDGIVLWLGAFIMKLLGVIAQFITQLGGTFLTIAVIAKSSLQNSPQPPNPIASAALSVTVGIVAELCRIAVTSWILPGYLRAQKDALEQSKKPTLSEVFSGKDRWTAMFFSQLLSTVIQLAVLIVGLLPMIFFLYWVDSLGGTHSINPIVVAALTGILALVGIGATVYTYLGLRLMDWFVVFDNASPVEAFQRSWGLAEGNRLRLFWFFLVLVAVQLVALVGGLILLLIGMLATVPAAQAFSDVAVTDAFLRAKPAHTPAKA